MNIHAHTHSLRGSNLAGLDSSRDAWDIEQGSAHELYTRWSEVVVPGSAVFWLVGWVRVPGPFVTTCPIPGTLVLSFLGPFFHTQRSR